MKTNVGLTDKAIRIVIALLITILIYKDILSGTLAIVAGIFAVILLLTTLIGFCPLYRIFGISTCKRK